MSDYQPINVWRCAKCGSNWARRAGDKAGDVACPRCLGEEMIAGYLDPAFHPGDVDDCKKCGKHTPTRDELAAWESADESIDGGEFSGGFDRWPKGWCRCDDAERTAHIPPAVPERKKPSLADSSATMSSVIGHDPWALFAQTHRTKKEGNN